MSYEIITTVTVLATATPPIGPYDLVTLADLKIDLNVTGTDEDAFLQRAISKSSAAIAQYCNRVFAVETLSEIFNIAQARLQWGGEALLQTSRWPVVAITSVIEDGTTLVRDTDYQVDLATGQFFRLNAGAVQRTGWGITPVTIVYESGYADIPLDLQDAATTVVKSMRANRERDPLLRSENILSGLYAYTLFDPNQVAGGGGTADQVSGILDNYRVPVIA